MPSHRIENICALPRGLKVAVAGRVRSWPRAVGHRPASGSAVGIIVMRRLMRTANILLILLVSIGGARRAGGADAEARARIAVLSYNIHHGVGVDGKLDLERIAEVIRSVSPDIVSLQEVDNRTSRSGQVDQAQELAGLTGMEAVFGASMDLGGGKYGNAVLTKLPVEASKCVPLPGEPRSALLVTVRLAHGTSRAERVTFAATHLDTAEAPRLESVALIEEAFLSDPDAPALLAGDLNALTGSATMLALAETWENATLREDLFTFPAGTPTRQIDYIMYRPSRRWAVVETRVLNEPVASDHRPILAVLELRPALDQPPGAARVSP